MCSRKIGTAYRKAGVSYVLLDIFDMFLVFAETPTLLFQTPDHYSTILASVPQIVYSSAFNLFYK